MPPRGEPVWEHYGFQEPPRPSQRPVHRSLDGIPVRNSPRKASVSSDGRFSVATDDGDSDAPLGTRRDPADPPDTPTSMAFQPSQSPPDDDASYSPTASEFDALEESFYDYEVQSTLADDTCTDVFSQNVSQIASSASYVRDAATQSPMSSLSPSSSVEDLKPHMFPDPKSLQHRLRMIWPRTPQGLDGAPFAVLWETMRVALHCQVDTSQIHLQNRPRHSWQDYDTLWASLKATPSLRSHRFPARSDPKAWRMCFKPHSGDEAVIFTATMHPAKSRLGPFMGLELHPLKREQSSRLLRRFGSDRFLEVRIPAVESWRCDADHDVVATAARWLAEDRHEFLGRSWSAFYVRDRQLKVEMPGDGPAAETRSAFYDRVLFFAEEGIGLMGAGMRSSLPPDSTSMGMSQAFQPSMVACSRRAMLDWLLNWKKNGSEKYLKLFHRVALGLSKTSPIITLQTDQIRNLKEDLRSPTPTREVMNDGAGRISPSLMRKVRDVLGLQATPSAIQGRFGSAKGMWLVDPHDPGLEDWIETYPAQRKWACDQGAEAHRTLEVRSWSTELAPASLNVQFLPILEDRAADPDKMRATFVRNMVTESEAQVEALRSCLGQPELFRKWIREGSSAQMSAQRLLGRAVPFLGGLPESQDDVMSFLADGGFEPLRLKFLQDLVFQRQRQKGEKMKEGLRINIARSTYAYMLVDFWGVLGPGEVHLSFSRFEYDDDGAELSDLDGVDVLVARAPAHLPSDIQKVKAVFRPELRHLRDVIIFSAQGEGPLAALLSGGDYDGDKAWVCWDPEIVDNFENHPLPPQPDLRPYLRKDGATLDDLHREYGEHRYVDAMIHQAFYFNLQKKFLGSCTSYKEKLCYHKFRVSDKPAINLSWLLSELADQPKQGITFGQADWNRFRDDMIGSRRELAPPAYKSGHVPYTYAAADGGKSLHIIDFLMGQANRVVDGALKDLSDFLKASGASTLDRAVTRHWDRLEASFGARVDPGGGGGARARFPWFPALRDGLRADVEACLGEWSALMGRKGAGQEYEDKVRIVYERWNAIKPRLPPAPINNGTHDPTAMILLRELVADGGGDDDDEEGEGLGNTHPPELGRWALLRASYAYKQHHHRQRFVWQMAGRQLQHLKARAVAGSSSVLVAPHMYAALRTDNVYIKRLMARVADGDQGVVGGAGGDDGEYGEGRGGLGEFSPGEEDE